VQTVQVQKVFVMRAQLLFTAAAIALSAPLSACASSVPLAYGVAAGPDDGLLAEPPADAKAGQCFAKVVVPGQPIYGPPAGPHLKWVQSPPPPGAIGPVWCQVWDQGYQPSVSYTPERYGWIRVICDKDATRDRISHVQRRLHEWGYYQGGYGGEFDAQTADAVRRFQDGRHIEHGGYLSFKTLEALELTPPPTYAQRYAPPVYAQPAPTYQQPIYQQPTYQQPTYQQPVYQERGYAAPNCPGACAQPVPQACGPAPCQGGYGYGYAPQGYGPTPPYAQRWLAWPGKASY
jgi:hypothetical protein